MNERMTSRRRDEACLLRWTAMKGVTAVEARSRRAYIRHTHDQFGIGLVLSGAQDSASGRGPVRAEAGQIISVNPNEVHDGHPVAGGTRHWKMLYFDAGVMAEAFAGLGASPGSELAHPVLDMPAAAAVFQALDETLTATGGTPLARDGLLTELLSALVERPAFRPEPAPCAVLPARRLIDGSPEEPVRLDELARLCGMSRFHFLRSFRAATGLPPHAYQVQRRLQKSRRLILQGAGLADAAAAGGFADQAHFTRHFVRAYGHGPGSLAKLRAAGR